MSSETRESLAKLQEALSAATSAVAIAESRERAEGHLREWRDRASRFYRQKAGEVKELMVMLARTAELVAERDRRYGPQLHEIVDRLQAVAEMEDLEAVRESVLESVAELNRTVEKMRQEGLDTVAALEAEVSAYRSKLEVTEQAAWVDALTGIGNRRRAEKELARRVEAGGRFCLILADLNGLKRVNDSHGHNAGDELLTHFAGELQHVVRASDVVARWGGDEFVILLDADRKAAESLIARIRQWAFGAYTLRSTAEPVRVEISAALGLAEWRHGLDQKAMLDAADREMYADKASHRIARLD